MCNKLVVLESESKWFFTSIPEVKEIVNATKHIKENNVFDINILI